MATSTTNISNVSLTVSGNTTKTATISWSLPSIPAGSTISSCTLTGTATASMSKGSATIKVNGTTVSSGSSFTINLGTGNTTSSVTATAQGGNKNAKGTVTLSNLKYTVTYTEPLATYTVTFKDWNGTVLKTQSVTSGSSATAPTNPSRTGYRFIGWDKTFTNITSDLTITAQYEQIITYTVTFVDYDGTVLKTQAVEAGFSATAPTSPSRAGYKFTGWDKSFSNITSNLTITAQYVVWYTLNIKENSSWVGIGKVFRKVNGIWVEETNENWVNLFNTTTDYRRKEMPVPIPTAILYEDGTLIFSPDYIVDESHGSIVATYIGWDTDVYTASSIPWYNDKANIKKVYINEIKPISTDYWFSGCSNLTSLDLNGFDTSNVTSMKYMFRNCSNLTSLDLSGFDTSSVVDMYYMFNSCSSLTSLDITNFDISNIPSMSYMFANCSNLASLDLSNFGTSNVTSVDNMFRNCSNLTSLDLGNFNSINVTSTYSWFNGCSSLVSLNLSSFDMTNVTNTTLMFANCTNLKTVYVKDQTAKTKIESSTGFPSTATVIIGSPT